MNMNMKIIKKNYMDMYRNTNMNMCMYKHVHDMRVYVNTKIDMDMYISMCMKN